MPLTNPIELLRRLRRAVAQGNQRAARGHRRAACRSRAMLELSIDKSVSSQEQQDLLTKANLFTVYDEPIPFWLQSKKTGGYRPICDLPNALRLRHYALGRIVDAQFRPRPHIFDYKSRGRDRQALQIAAALESGNEWVFVCDIRSCFQNVNPEALYSLPLPNSVIRTSLDARELKFQHRRDGIRERISSHVNLSEDYLRQRQMEPCGLMQGSPISNLILAWLFNDLPSCLPTDCVPFLLCDNIIVLAREETRCRAIEQSLSDYFSSHHAGPFVLEGDRSHLHLGIEFAGYRYSRRLGGKVIIDPATDNLFWLQNDIINACEADAKAGHAHPHNVELVLQRKLSGYRSWTDREDFRNGHLQNAILQLSNDYGGLLGN